MSKDMVGVLVRMTGEQKSRLDALAASKGKDVPSYLLEAALGVGLSADEVATRRMINEMGEVVRILDEDFAPYLTRLERAVGTGKLRLVGGKG